MKARAQSGFSLLELVAAFVIFALAFGALMQLAGAAMKGSRQSASYTQAALWAQSKLDEAGVGEPLKETEDEGEFDKQYRWRLIVRKMEPIANAAGTVEAMPLDLFRMELTVLWQEAGRDREAAFVTMRAMQVEQGLNK